MPHPSWIRSAEVRKRIEAALPPEAQDTLAMLLRGYGIDRAGWMAVPHLRQTFAGVALQRIARRIETAEGRSREEALQTAALRLGIPEGTAVTWSRRWPDQAQDAA